MLVERGLLTLTIYDRSYIWKHKIKRLFGILGLSDKTLWDLIQLIIIPIVIAFATFWFTNQNNELNRSLAEETSRENILKNYYSDISTLILDEDLLHSENGSNVSIIARTKTLSTLRRLDGVRKGYVLAFLYEAGVISGEEPIISLVDADFRDTFLNFVDLEGVNLNGADFRRADLAGTNFEGAYLELTDFSYANIQCLNLRGVHINYTHFTQSLLVGSLMEDTDFSKAYFSGADLSLCHLDDSVFDPYTYSDNTIIWPDDFVLP
mgnify:CR=1 FL=1